MASSINYAQIQNTAKEIYGKPESFQKASPMTQDIIKQFPFEAGDEPGSTYSQGLRMTEEWGFGRRAAGQAATTMRPPIALKTEKISFLPGRLEFRTQIDGEALDRAQSSKQNFKEAVGLRMEGMRDSCLKLTEWNLLNGGRPCGVIKSGGIAAGSDATRKVITFTDESWVGGFWAGTENMPVDIYNAASISLSGGATKRNSSSATNQYYVDSYDLDAKTVTFRADDSADWTNVVAGDAVWLATHYLTEPLGMTVISQVSSTYNLFGLTRAQYGIWGGVVDSVGGSLTLPRVMSMLAKLSERSGGAKTMYELRCSARVFSGLNADLLGSRRYDTSHSRKIENGVERLEVYGPNGHVSIQTHLYMPDGVAHICDPRVYTRRGVKDLDFTAPGGSGDYLLVRPDVDAMEYRATSQQGIFCDRPGGTGVFTGLTVPA